MFEPNLSSRLGCVSVMSSLCSLLSLAPPADYLQAVQASAVLACIFSIVGIFVFVAQLFMLSKGKRFTISGIFQFLACEYFSFSSLLSCSPLSALTHADVSARPPGLCIMIAASIYTDRFHKEGADGWYGHCFILAWISFALTFISSITYFVLRKKTA